MKITSKIDAVDDWICNETLATVYDSCCLPQEKEIMLEDTAISSLRSTQISAKGLFIIDTQMTFNQPVSDTFSVTGESIILGFYLEGEASAEISGLLESNGHPPNIHYICYTPYFIAEFRMPPHRLHHYFLVILSREFYFRLLHQHSELHQDFAQQVLAGKHTFLSDTPQEITAEMKWVLNDIRSSQRKGPLKRLFLEAKVIELLMLQLEQWQQQQPRQGVLRGEDVQRFKEAKAILEDNFQNPPTIQALARLVCLNETKLKQGFKTCFNYTIHGYVVRLRMEKAKQLLLKSQHSIGDIAHQVGYKNSAHFTVAFKKYFSFLPSEIKV